MFLFGKHSVPDHQLTTSANFLSVWQETIYYIYINTSHPEQGGHPNFLYF
jgi:hypothetical protein